MFRFLKFLIKTAFYLAFLLLLFAICVVGIGLWVGPKFAPRMIDTWLENKTGFSSSIDKIYAKYLSGSFEIDQIHIYNPPYYQYKNFVHIDKVLTKVQPTSVFKDTFYVDYLYIDVNTVTAVRTPDNSINFKEFADAFKKKGSSPSTPKPASPSPAGPSQSPVQQSPEVSNITAPTKGIKRFTELPKGFVIKRLVVQIDNFDMVGFLDSGSEPKRYALNYKREFANVTDMDSIKDAIAQDMQNLGIRIFSDLLLNVPMQILNQHIDKIPDTVIQQLGSKAGKLGSDLGRTVEKGVKGVIDSLKKF